MITHIKLQNIRGVSLAANLHPLTCIAGANGTGKTSILMAIETALIGSHPYFQSNQWQAYMRSAKDWMIRIEADSQSREFTDGIKALVPSPLGAQIERRIQWMIASSPERTRRLAEAAGADYLALQHAMEVARKELNDSRADLRAATHSLQSSITERDKLKLDPVDDSEIVAATKEKEAARTKYNEATDSAQEAHMRRVAANEQIDIAGIEQSLREIEGDGKWRLAIEAKGCQSEMCPVCGTSPWKPVDVSSRIEDIEILGYDLRQARQAAANAAGAAKKRETTEDELIARSVYDRACAVETELYERRRAATRAEVLEETVRNCQARITELEAIVKGATEKAASTTAAFEQASLSAWEQLCKYAAEALKQITGKDYEVVERSGKLALVIGGQVLPEIAMSGGERIAIDVAVARLFHPELLLLDEAGRLSSDAFARVVTYASRIFDQIIYCVPEDHPLTISGWEMRVMK